jgi:hypothetical protein
VSSFGLIDVSFGEDGISDVIICGIVCLRNELSNSSDLNAKCAIISLIKLAYLTCSDSFPPFPSSCPIRVCRIVGVEAR